MENIFNGKPIAKILDRFSLDSVKSQEHNNNVNEGKKSLEEPRYKLLLSIGLRP
jgi:hypothetical protein